MDAKRLDELEHILRTHPDVWDHATLTDFCSEVRRLREWIKFWLDDSRDECVLASVPVDQLRDALAGEKVKP